MARDPLGIGDVDIVVPFCGPQSGLDALRERLLAARLEAAASVTIVDNRPVAGAVDRDGPLAVLAAPERQSSYFARNRGARVGSAEWIVFLDADVLPAPNLLSAYLDPRPGAEVAVLAGGVVDEPPEQGAELSAAAAYAHLRAHMSQANTLKDGPWGYAQTANCAVRREAFERVGGFEDGIRSGGDADLCFRLRALGLAIESRPEAAVIHRSRQSLRALLRQRARHGSGAAWLDARYPGAFPRARYPGLLAWGVRRLATAAALRARGRRQAAIEAGVEPLSVWAFELGRLASNRVAGSGPLEPTPT